MGEMQSETYAKPASADAAGEEETELLHLCVRGEHIGFELRRRGAAVEQETSDKVKPGSSILLAARTCARGSKLERD